MLVLVLLCLRVCVLVLLHMPPSKVGKRERASPLAGEGTCGINRANALPQSLGSGPWGRGALFFLKLRFRAPLWYVKRAPKNITRVARAKAAITNAAKAVTKDTNG